MNVLVINKNESIINDLDIEIIKTIKGEFEVEEIVNSLSNLFFSRVIIDITSIKDFNDFSNLQKLTIGIPVDKIILVLPNDSSFTSDLFISKLISMGYYNFTTNVAGIKYLINKPNTYKEVAHLHKINEVSNNSNVSRTGRVIGFKNVTEHAGSTTLVYALKKQLESFYKLSVCAIEVGRKDFLYFKDDRLISTEKNNFSEELVKNKHNNIILVDLNDSDDIMCDEVFYLIEPSIIKFNKLIENNRFILSSLKSKKIILNKSLLPGNDVSRFSRETELKIFSVIAPFNDRREDLFLDEFIKSLGIN